MHDLRKKILLESGKTMSRKARSRPASNFGSGTQSPSSSPAGSRQASRAPSRYASEEELSDSDLNDSLTNSVIASEDFEDHGGSITDWTDRLKGCIADMLERKGTSTQGREKLLAGYVHLTRNHFADTIIESQLHDLLPAIMRSIRNGRNTEETVAALKALQTTIITTQSESIYDSAYSTLKSLCEDSGEEAVKVESIYTMAIATIMGGGNETAAEELMDFLFEIVESDGHLIEAGDNAPVVTAALTGWGFLATHMDDLEQQSQEVLEAFTDQLDSSDAVVQIAAGTNIALIFEAVRAFNELAEEEHDKRQEELRLDAKRDRRPFSPEPYNPFDLQYNQHQLVQRISELASESSRSVSKKHRRQLRACFKSILTSIELGKGPAYSTAGRVPRESDRAGDRVFDNEKVFEEFGYRETVRVGNGKEPLVIDSWSKSLRVQYFRRALVAGFEIHWAHNPALEESFFSA